MKKRDTCNVVQAHKRILEAHRLWHQALDCYFDPEGFRTNINAAIQAIRNVTFAIQNEKHNIPNYDTWYTVWQACLKEDEIMRWLCEARTNIVHKKDLEIYSQATVTVRCYETILKATVAFPPFLSGKSILKYLIDEDIIDSNWGKVDAYAVIERRWIINDLPEHDILYYLAYGIGQLFLLVQEAHKSVQNNIDSCSVVDLLHPLLLNADKIPVCMSFTEKPMQETMELSNFITRQTFIREIHPNQELDKVARHRYKKVFNNGGIPTATNPFEFGENLFSIAKDVLKKDGHHINLLFSQSSDLKWTMISPVFEDQVSKHIFWNDMANRIKVDNIISIIFLGECWVGSTEVMHETGLRASQQPDRKEALVIDIFTSKMQSKSLRVLFHRNILGKIIFDSETEDFNNDMSIGYIKPIADIWIENAHLSKD